MNGSDLYKKYPEAIFVKVVREKLLMKDYQYVLDQISEDKHEFSTEKCSKGGFYFIDVINLYEYASTGEYGYHIVDVKVPFDAEVCDFGNKFKASKILLTNLRPLSKFIVDDENILNKMIEHDQRNAIFGPDQPFDLCKKLMLDNFTTRHFIRSMTVELLTEVLDKSRGLIRIMMYDSVLSKELCLEIVKKFPNVLLYIKEQTEDICLAAVKQNGYTLEHVKNQSLQICLEAVRQTGYAVIYVNEQMNGTIREQIYLEAVKQNGYALEYIKNQTEQIYLEAVKQNGHALKHVINQTEQICLEAVKQNGHALKYVINQTKEICLEAVKLDII